MLGFDFVRRYVAERLPNFSKNVPSSIPSHSTFERNLFFFKFETNYSWILGKFNASAPHFRSADSAGCLRCFEGNNSHMSRSKYHLCTDKTSSERKRGTVPHSQQICLEFRYYTCVVYSKLNTTIYQKIIFDVTLTFLVGFFYHL